MILQRGEGDANKKILQTSCKSRQSRPYIDFGHPPEHPSAVGPPSLLLRTTAMSNPSPNEGADKEKVVKKSGKIVLNCDNSQVRCLPDWPAG